jgi:hypothetical protein
MSCWDAPRTSHAEEDAPCQEPKKARWGAVAEEEHLPRRVQVAAIRCRQSAGAGPLVLRDDAVISTRRSTAQNWCSDALRF